MTLNLTEEQERVFNLLQDEIIRLSAYRLDYLSGDLNELKTTVGFQDFNTFLTIGPDLD